MALSRPTNSNTQLMWGDPNKGEAHAATGTGRETVAATGYSRAARLPGTGGRFAIHLLWDATGAPNGTFTLQYSLVPNPDESSDADWVTDSTVTVLGSTLTVAGAAGNTLIVASAAPPGGWFRLKWTRSSGSLDVAAHVANEGKS